MTAATASASRKDAALEALAARRERYVRDGQRVLLLTLLRCGRATADDVRDAVILPAGIDPVCLGAVPGALVRAGIIRRAGYTPTVRPEGHARPVSVWELADADLARRWIDDHPAAVGPDDPPQRQRTMPWGDGGRDGT